MKNIGQKCVKCGETNHTTQNHWPRGKCPNRGKGQKSQKVSSSSGNKRNVDKKGNGKEKAPVSANVLDIMDIGELSITSSELINFSCYETSEKVEWFLDSGCTDHITPRKSDFVQYRELGQTHSAEIADGELRVMEQLSDTAYCQKALPHCRSETCYMFQRQISSFFVDCHRTTWKYVYPK